MHVLCSEDFCMFEYIQDFNCFSTLQLVCKALQLINCMVCTVIMACRRQSQAVAAQLKARDLVWSMRL